MDIPECGNQNFEIIRKYLGNYLHVLSIGYKKHNSQREILINWTTLKFKTLV
jgi:hypothetical protein